MLIHFLSGNGSINSTRGRVEPASGPLVVMKGAVIFLPAVGIRLHARLNPNFVSALRD